MITIPARRFHTVRTVPKRLLPTHILDVVTKPNAFVQFGRSDTNDLHDMSYDSFSRDDEHSSTFRVSEREYNLEHDLYFAAFIKVIAANVRALAEDASQPYSIEDALLKDFGDYIPTLQSNVNSPGWLRLKSVHITPLLASVLLSLALTVGPEAVQAAEDGLIIIGNSKAPEDDPCIAIVRESALDFFGLIGLDTWSQACELARKVNAGSGMRSQSIVSQPGGQ